MTKRFALVSAVYLALFSVCYIGAFLLRFDFELSDRVVSRMLATLPMVLFVKGLAIVASREWRRRHRYTTLSDVLHVCLTAVATATTLFVINYFCPPNWNVPRSVILIDAMLAVMAAVGLRATIRMYIEQQAGQRGKATSRRTLIYGGGEAAAALLRTIRATAPQYNVVGLIDPDNETARSLVGGVKVYAGTRNLERLAKLLDAEDVLITTELSGRQVRAMLRRCEEAGLQAHIVPHVGEIVEGRYKLGVRDVEITDLLRREPAQLDIEAIRHYITGKRVLVTGAAGSIGSEICRQVLAMKPDKLVLLDQSESGVFFMEQEFLALGTDTAERLSFQIADLLDSVTITRVMQELSPQIVFHAAAYKHVPLMESNPQQAIRNNVLGTKAIVDAAIAHDVERFVMISTDKAVRPSSIMGASKLMAEKYVQVAARTSTTRLITVRFGNVLNSVGSVVPKFRQQIQAGGPITVTHPEMDRYFMTIPEAVQLVLQAGAIGGTGDVLILDMGEPVRIVDLAKDMIYLSGLKYPDDVDIVFTGMRPGEKLSEELFYANEANASRVHEKIYCSHANAEVSPQDIIKQIRELEAALHGPPQDAGTLLRKYVDGHSAADDRSIRKAAA